MLSFRYVLILERGERHHVVRHSSFRPLRVGDVLSTADRGEWVVRKIVESEDSTFRDGVAHCEPAPSASGSGDLSDGTDFPGENAVPAAER